jgi:hypothetical protein
MTRTDARHRSRRRLPLPALAAALALLIAPTFALAEVAGPDTLPPVAPPKAPVDRPAPATPKPDAPPPPVPPPAPVPKAPEPDAAAQKAAEAQIRDIFKAEYARHAPADQQALAAKLLQQAVETKDDPVGRFVLLREARDLAAQAGDAATALAAVDRMAAAYAVDALPLKTAALAVAGRILRTPEAATQVAQAYLALAGEAEDADQYEAAAALASKAESAARTGKDAALADEAQSRRKEIEALRTEHNAVKDAEKTLKETPDDPAACLAVGRFVCLAKGDWEKGLPLLARGSDAALQALAEKERAAPATAEQQAALGDGWWDAAAGKSGTAKARLQARAVHWYEKALPGMAGITKARIASRIESATRVEGGADVPRAGLAFWVEPGASPGAPFRDLRSGIAGEPKGGVAPAPGSAALAFAAGTQVVYPVTPASASVTRAGTILAWLKPDDVAQFGCVVNRCENRAEGPEDFGLYVRAGHLNVYFNWDPPDVAPIGSSTGALPAGKWFLGGAAWDESTLTFFIDGKKDSAIPLKKGTPQSRGSKVVLGVSVPGGAEYYRGLVGALLIYNRALSEAEIQRLHAATARKFR